MARARTASRSGGILRVVIWGAAASASCSSEPPDDCSVVLVPDASIALEPRAYGNDYHFEVFVDGTSVGACSPDFCVCDTGTGGASGSGGAAGSVGPGEYCLQGGIPYPCNNCSGLVSVTIPGFGADLEISTVRLGFQPARATLVIRHADAVVCTREVVFEYRTEYPDGPECSGLRVGHASVDCGRLD